MAVPLYLGMLLQLIASVSNQLAVILQLSAVSDRHYLNIKVLSVWRLAQDLGGSGPDSQSSRGRYWSYQRNVT